MKGVESSRICIEGELRLSLPLKRVLMRFILVVVIPLLCAPPDGWRHSLEVLGSPAPVPNSPSCQYPVPSNCMSFQLCVASLHCLCALPQKVVSPSRFLDNTCALPQLCNGQHLWRHKGLKVDCIKKNRCRDKVLTEGYL